jgi:hypothetical protein
MIFFCFAQLWVSSPSLARDGPASHEDRSDCGGGMALVEIIWNRPEYLEGPKYSISTGNREILEQPACPKKRRKTPS